MSSDRKEFPLGRFHIIRYDLSKTGDIIPKHHHQGPNSGHISIITGKGTVVARTTGHDDLVLEGGDVVEWPDDTEHEWECLTPLVRIVNIFSR